MLNKFSSPRLNFRTLGEWDVTERYVNWLNDPEVNKYLEIRFCQHDLESCKKFVAATNTDKDSHLFGIFDKASNLHIGNIKVGFIRQRYQSGQVSLLIGDKSFWGQGYASEAIRTITKWSFEELELERLEAGCVDSNLGSLRAFVKAGYTVEGYFRKNTVIEDSRQGSFWLGVLRNEY